MRRAFSGIRRELLLWIFVPCALIVAALVYVAMFVHHDQVRSLVAQRDMRMVMSISRVLGTELSDDPDGSLNFDPQRLANVIDPMPGDGQVIAFIFDARGRIVWHTDGTLVGRSVAQHAGVREALSGNHGTMFVADAAASHSGSAAEQVVSFAQIPRAGQWLGLVIEEDWQRLVNPLLRGSFLIPLAMTPVLLLAVLALTFALRRVILPLRALARHGAAFGAGDVAALNNPISGISEIEDLAAAFSGMAQQLGVANARLRDYSKTLTRVQESERAQLARDLHDETLQGLVSLKQQIQAARRQADKRGAPELSARMSELGAQAQHIIVDVRRVTRNLRPLMLDELGLAGALERLASDSAQTNPDKQVTFSTHGTLPRVSDEESLMLYRIAREAISNAVRHARASKIAIVLLVESPAQITLMIEDDGAGFDTATVGPGMGLLNMRERAEDTGAAFSVSSGRSGTRVRVALSCHAAVS